MSGLVDFIVAGRTQGKALADAIKLDSSRPRASAKFVFEYHLAGLWKLLAGTEPNEDFPELAQKSPWRVCCLPPPFVKLLAAIKEEAVPELARQWYDGWDSQALQSEGSLGELLGELAALARQAKAGRKAVLVRESQGQQRLPLSRNPVPQGGCNDDRTD